MSILELLKQRLRAKAGPQEPQPAPSIKAAGDVLGAMIIRMALRVAAEATDDLIRTVDMTTRVQALGELKGLVAAGRVPVNDLAAKLLLALQGAALVSPPSDEQQLEAEVEALRKGKP